MYRIKILHKFGVKLLAQKGAKGVQRYAKENIESEIGGVTVTYVTNPLHCISFFSCSFLIFLSIFCRVASTGRRLYLAFSPAR